MASEVSLRDITTGVPVFYSNYEDAHDNANDYDEINIYANLDECIKTNVDTELEINCDYIEGVGKVSDGFAGVSIRIENGEKFHLTCNKVINQNNVAKYISSSNPINNLNFRIEKVETGVLGNSSSGSTAVIIRGNGIIKFDEVVCNNLDHCLSQRDGSIIAIIRKLITTAIKMVQLRVFMFRVIPKVQKIRA